jgi:ABC-type multidrug transport system permease subunit
LDERPTRWVAPPVSMACVTSGTERDWVEIVATVLLAVATVATAWSAYQANRWGGEQAKATSRSNAARIESTRASGLANRQVEIDVALFTQFVDAFAREETELADFYRARFRDEFKPAFEAWTATRPRTNPDAPLTPFELPQYRLAANEEAERLQATAEEFAADARRNIQRSSNYVLAVVLFASALFFAGISTKLSAQRARAVVVVVGCMLFAGTLLWVATSPISVSV